MTMTITDLAGVTRAALSGRLDTVSVGKVETSFISGIVPRARHTVVDMSGVTFVASLGIRMLLSAARGLNRGGARLVIFGARPAVLDIFETTALTSIIPVFDDESAALAEVAG